jgi:hypothetical protein
MFLPFIAKWSRTLPTPHENLRCETSVECRSEAEFHCAIRDNLLSVGVLEWPVCKQRDELLPVWTVPAYVLLMNIALLWEMTPF